MTEPGFVYALINPSLDGIVKIGSTTRDPEMRAKELSAATGVPTPFIVAYSISVSDALSAEAHVHTALEQRGFRVSENREFFHAKLPEVIECMLQIRSQDIHLASRPSQHENGSSDDTRSPASHDTDPADEVYGMAENYLYGLGDCIQDNNEAFQLFKKAAKMRHPKAFLQLGIMQAYGDGCTKDYQKALSWHKEGAQHGAYECHAEMAQMYYNLEQDENSRKCWAKYFADKSFGDDKSSIIPSLYFYIIQYYLDGLDHYEYIHPYLDDLHNFASTQYLKSANWCNEAPLRFICRLQEGKGCDGQIHKAIETHDLEMLSQLIGSGADANARNSQGNSPLHIAANKGFDDVAHLLLAAGANPDCDNDELNTPLTIAASCGHAALCGVLLKYGANPDKRGKFGISPLHWAVTRYSTDIIRRLMAAGANINIKDGGNQTSLETLQKYMQDDIEEYGESAIFDERLNLITELEGYGAI